MKDTRALRHIFGGICREIVSYFKKELNNLPPHIIIRELKSMIMNMAIYTNNVPMDILEIYSKNGESIACKLTEDLQFKEACSKLFEYSFFQKNIPELKLMISKIKSTVFLIKSKETIFNEIGRELQLILLSNKVEILKIDKNKKLFAQINQLEYLLSILINAFDIEMLEIDLDNFTYISKQEAIENLVYWTSLLLILERFIYQCGMLNSSEKF